MQKEGISLNLEEITSKFVGLMFCSFVGDKQEMRVRPAGGAHSTSSTSFLLFTS